MLGLRLRGGGGVVVLFCEWCFGFIYYFWFFCGLFFGGEVFFFFSLGSFVFGLVTLKTEEKEKDE